MKYFVDGDQIVFTKDDFIDLQESPAVFVPLNSNTAQAVLENKSVGYLPVGDLTAIAKLLRHGGGELILQ